jgi:hypothetical protein
VRRIKDEVGGGRPDKVREKEKGKVGSPRGRQEVRLN